MPSKPNVIRYKYDAKSCLSPDIYQMGWAVFNEPVHDSENLPRHSHDELFEICYIAHGNVDWFAGDAVYEIQAGQVFLVFPGEEHGGCHEIMNPCELYWVQFRFPENGTLSGMTPAETELLSERISAIQSRLFSATSDVPLYFKCILEEQRIPTEYSSIIVKTALSGLLVATLRSFEVYNKQKMLAPDKKFSVPIARARRIIQSNLSNELKVAEIAKEIGLGTTSFYHLFAQEVHLTPGEYLTQQRLRLAKELLLNSKMNITAIAHHIGYSSSQYFSTIFKKVTGLTPNQFRKKLS